MAEFGIAGAESHLLRLGRTGIYLSYDVHNHGGLRMRVFCRQIQRYESGQIENFFNFKYLY